MLAHILTVKQKHEGFLHMQKQTHKYWTLSLLPHAATQAQMQGLWLVHMHTNIYWYHKEEGGWQMGLYLYPGAWRRLSSFQQGCSVNLQSFYLQEDVSNRNRINSAASLSGSAWVGGIGYEDRQLWSVFRPPYGNYFSTTFMLQLSCYLCTCLISCIHAISKLDCSELCIYIHTFIYTHTYFTCICNQLLQIGVFLLNWE